MSNRSLDKYREVLRARIKARTIVNSCGCWDWGGRMKKVNSKDAKAAPIPRLRTTAKKYGVDLWYATHAAWLAFKGELPTGSVFRSCCNNKCVNPAHLVILSPSECSRRGIEKAKRPPRHSPLKYVSRDMLDDALRLHDGNVSLAAEWLHVTEHSIRLRLTRWGLSVKDYQSLNGVSS